jgi:prephenate dehydrogenase
VSTSKPRITIVGLGMVGSSLGLALRQAEVASAIVGHDLDRMASTEAKKLGAVDRTHWNLISACEDADLVILAIPVGAIEDSLEAIGADLRPGCVVMDTAAVKGPVMAWAAGHLPAGIHFVGTNPILSTTISGGGGLEAARADLFQRGLFCIVPSTTADAASVKLVADLVTIVGAKPLFLEAAEHDGLLAAVDHLPDLLALAMLETVIHQPTWRELRKVAGPAFDASTQLVTAASLAQSDLYGLNRENVLRWLDALSRSLATIRENLAAGQSEALAEQFQKAFQERQQWLADRTTGEWHEGPRTEMPPKMSMMDAFLGTFWRRKPRKEE